ncbi:MAG: oligosaccharide flippase family protein [Leeuwenhoekiella sp.]
MLATIKRFGAAGSVFKNFSVLTISNALTQLLAMIISIKIARSLNPEQFGTYNLLLVHVNIFVVVASVGIRRTIVRDIARDKSIVQQVLSYSIILRIVGILLSVIAFGIYFYFFHQYEVFLFLLVVLSIISAVFFDHFDSLAFGLEKMEYSGFISFISTSLWLLTILFLPKENLTLKTVFLIYFVFSTLKTILYIFVKKKRLKYKTDFSLANKEGVVHFGKESFPFYYLDLFSLLSIQIPILFLEYRSGTEQIGFFNIANKILIPINLVVGTALSAIFPNLARLYTNNFERFVSSVKSIFIIISLLGITGAFGITFFREEIILLLYSEKYISSSLVVGYQCWYVAVFSVVCLMGTILGAINRQKELGYISFFCTFIQVPILWYGAKGGAIDLSAGFLVATVINMIIHFFAIHIYLDKSINILFYLKITVLFILAYVSSLFFPIEIDFLYRALIFIALFFGGATLVYLKYYKLVKNYISR